MVTQCEECNGFGKVIIAKLYPNGHTEIEEECVACSGEGYIVTNSELEIEIW